MNRETKTKVVRVSEKEERLLNYIRKSGGKLVNEINSAFTELSNKEDYLTMKGVVSIIEDRCFMNLETLIATDFISEDKAQLLIRALQQNKNVIIVGKSGCGKTTLLNSLLEYQTDVRMLILEKIPEVFVSETQKDNEELNVKVDMVESDRVSFEPIVDLLNVLEQPSKRVVYNELWNMEYRLSLLTALNMGVSVIAADCLGRDDWKTSFIDRCESGSRVYAKDTLDKHSFVIATVCIDELGRRRVLKVEEI